MSSDEIALLRKIQQNKDADLPRLVYADWLEEQDRTDHDAAVAQFIRLSCDGRPARNAKGRLNPVNKDAREWLAANWRRLLPRLCQDWDKAEKLMQEEQEAYDRQRQKIARMNAEAARAIESGDLSRTSLGAFFDVDLTVEMDAMFSLVTARRRCYSKCGGLAAEYVIGVPFFLVSWRGEEQCYTPKVRFQRGFAASASWNAPNLGPLIAKRLAYDQPLAHTAGPGNIDDVFQYLSAR